MIRAEFRDAIKWSGYIDEVIELFPDVEVYFGSHHWPIWGHDRIINFLEKQRDTYKYINDQTLRLALHGATPREIAEELELPESLRASFANRGYYGNLWYECAERFGDTAFIRAGSPGSSHSVPLRWGPVSSRSSGPIVTKSVSKGGCCSTQSTRRWSTPIP